MTTEVVPSELAAGASAKDSRGRFGALKTGWTATRAVVAALSRVVWRFVGPFAKVISRAGWIVVLIAAVCLILAAVFGWLEFFFLGATLAAAIVVAVFFVFGRSTYEVLIELSPRRVIVGDKALGRLLVTNNGEKGLLPTRMELPVGEGVAEFAIPQLAPGANHEELFAVPTSRRAVIVAGPAVSVRGDQLGLLRRTVRWNDPVDLFVHPITTRLASSAAGLVRDLEGQVSKKITNNDISFHALRAYVPGDDRRYVHWRTSARTGQLMVRQFEETRRSQLTIVHSTNTNYYASDEEFELAVSVTTSVAGQVIRDATQVSVVTEAMALRTHSAMAMMDDSCRLERTPKKFSTAREFARETTKRLPAPSVVMIVTGSKITTQELRSIESLFAVDTTVMALRIDAGAAPGMASVNGLVVFTIGELADLPKLLRRVQ